MQINPQPHTDLDCCSTDDRPVMPAPPSALPPVQISAAETYKPYIFPGISLVLLLAGMLLERLQPPWLGEYGLLAIYTVAYLLVGAEVLWTAVKKISSGDIFNEFLLMGIATLGAFAIGEYEEGVAVMLFYAVGELFQGAAVSRSKRSIRALLEVQAQEVGVLDNGQVRIKHPQQVQAGEVIQVKAGEKVALDGVLVSERASFNTAALTGESVPQTRRQGEEVLAGMINLQTVADIRTTSRYADTRLSRILAMVQEATARKAPTQRFISRFAKSYTPAVVFLAVALTFLPYFFVSDYVFRDWLYRALVFLVVSCPCALLVSIPLGYFGGIGAASQRGVLFKGANFLDLMRQVDTVVFDKTGTLTKGVFAVQEVQALGIPEKELVQLAAALEAKSAHPVAQALVEYAGSGYEQLAVKSMEEISGFGLRGEVDRQSVLVGKPGLLRQQGIAFDPELETMVGTVVAVAIDGTYRGFLRVADEVREDAAKTISDLKQAGVRHIVMLSGDQEAVVQQTAAALGITEAYGNLLPEDKAAKVTALQAQNRKVAFVGDGINDAPVLALADVGIALGGLGSDVAVETADVVIQTDQPSRVATAIGVARATHRIVWQNIGLAFGVKLAVLALGAGGIATMWEAVFADVGVALLAILNAVRIQRIKF